MFKVGDYVAYGLHGKCVIIAIEEKKISSGGEGQPSAVLFYQMRPVKNSIIPRAPSPNDPQILIPVERAEDKGLRPLLQKEQADSILQVLASRTDSFSDEPWIQKQKKLEDVIRREGPVGLAKVIGHLHVILKQDSTVQPSVTKFYESTYKLLARELGDALGLVSKDIDTLLQKTLKNRLAYEA